MYVEIIFVKEQKYLITTKFTFVTAKRCFRLGLLSAIKTFFKLKKYKEI